MNPIDAALILKIVGDFIPDNAVGRRAVNRTTGLLQDSDAPKIIRAIQAAAAQQEEVTITSLRNLAEHNQLHATTVAGGGFLNQCGPARHTSESKEHSNYESALLSHARALGSCFANGSHRNAVYH